LGKLPEKKGGFAYSGARKEGKMYLMVLNGQIISADDIPTLFQILGEYTKAQFSVREYIIQARLPGENKARPLVAMLHKQYPTFFVVLPVLHFSVPANKV
jgi:hypothetical protein